MIHFDNVSKHYGGQSQALSSITVQIKDGDFVFLIGPSGAGKTTILRLLIREILPTDGNVYIDSWHINAIPPSHVHLLRRHVGTVFQDFKLIVDRTVFENVAVGLEILGKTDTDIAAEVDEVLKLVGLSEQQTKFPRELSAGEMQRTAIARAIVGGPKILLADEPTGNLDPQTAADIIHLLLEINKIGTTVVMATHNVSVVNHLSKRTITLLEGSIVSDEKQGKYLVSSRRTHESIAVGKKHAGSTEAEIQGGHHAST